MQQAKIRDTGIVSEIIEGEAIIMDLKSGIYFSSLGAGALIWSGIVEGISHSQITETICKIYDVSPEDLRGDFDAFLNSAVSNDLIYIESPSDQTTRNWAVEIPDARLAYAAPTLNCYGDMQDLALLDPIHDVQEQGWPKRKETADGPGSASGH